MLDEVFGRKKKRIKRFDWLRSLHKVATKNLVSSSMSTNLLLKTPKTHKGRRIQAEREPKVVENVKKAMFIKTNKTSQHMSDVLTDLVCLTTLYNSNILNINSML